MVQVSTWAELIAAIQGTDDVKWVGNSFLPEVNLTVASTYDAYTYYVRSKNIDFNGLRIGRITTSGARDFGETESVQRMSWMFGFAVFYTPTSTVQNLTVDKIILENPRDILVKHGTYLTFKSCYFYDVYAPSAEPDTMWLMDSGNEDDAKSTWHSFYGNNKLRAMSNYIVGHTSYSSLGYPRYDNYLYFEYCICNVRSENCGIMPAKGSYTCCEVEFDYTFDWDETTAMAAATVDYVKLCIFPSGFRYVVQTTFNAVITINTDWEIALSERFRIPVEHSPGYDFIVTFNELGETGSAYGGSLVNFKTKVKNNNFEGISENREYTFPYIMWEQENPAGFVFVTNNGDNHFEDVPDCCAYLLGDLRNFDLMRQHSLETIDDDGKRYDQYYTEDNGKWSTADWRRRFYPATNDGIPFLPFWYYPYHEPAPSGGEAEHNYISIYDMDTKQDEFDNNGLILEPSRCIVTEELNGGYNLTLEHPKDKTGKWKHILEMNIIKCLGQLFIIRKVTSATRAGSKIITAYAEHISYHLNDYWLFPQTSIAGYMGQTLINSIQAQMWDVPWDEENNLRYTFDIKTNLNADPTFKEWYEMPEGHTPWEMLLGSNGFTQLIGGEVYRNNFRISIYERMEGAQDNAFVIHPDLNLKSITRTVDLNTFCTYFRGYDEYGGWFAIAWDPRTLPRSYPHNIVRSQNFTFDVDEEYYDFAMLARKTGEYFQRVCAPLVSFKIQVQDLKDHPDYKDFVNNYRFKVGDMGKVWDDESERYYELEITKTVKDGITGRCLEVTIGTERSFTRPEASPVETSKNFHSDEVAEHDGDTPDVEEYWNTTAVDYEYEIIDAYVRLIKYIGTQTAIIIPSEIEGKPVRVIGEECFMDTLITAVKIPNSVEVIE